MAKYGRPDFGSGGTRAGVSAGRARVTVRRVSDADAKAIAEKAAGAKGRRLVSMEAKDKYGKPIKGSPPITDAKPAKTIKVEPSEKLTGRPAGESTVTKTKKPDVKPSMTKKAFKDWGGGSVSPGQRAAIKGAMDKGLKSDAKIVEAKIPKTEPVRPPKGEIRSYKKVIKPIVKVKPTTIGDKPKPRIDKPVQGPVKIKRRQPPEGTSDMGGYAPGVKFVENKETPNYSTVNNKSESTQSGSNTNKKNAPFYKLGIKEKDTKPRVVNRPKKEIPKENPTRPSTLAEQRRQRLITKIKEKQIAKQRTKTIKSARAKQEELARIQRKQKEFEASQKRNN